MKKTPDIRIKNAECRYNGLKDEKELDLLRECVKSIFTEQRAEQYREEKRKNNRRILPPPIRRKNRETTENSQ